MRLGFVSPYRPAGLDKLGWAADASRVLGHEPERLRTLADVQRADAELPLLVFEQFSAGLNEHDLCTIAAGHRAVWVQWCFDLLDRDPARRLAEQAQVIAWGSVMRAMDVCFVKESALLGEYAAVGVNAVYLDQACPADMPACQHSDVPDWDVLVIGAYDRPQRMRDALALARACFNVAWICKPCSFRLPAALEPVAWCEPKALPAVVSRAGMVLSVDYRSDVQGYHSDRLHLLAGMGACVLHRGEPVADVSALYYANETELLDLAGRYAADRTARAAVGTACRESIFKHHTYEHRIRELLRAVGRLVPLETAV